MAESLANDLKPFVDQTRDRAEASRTWTRGLGAFPRVPETGFAVLLGSLVLNLLSLGLPIVILQIYDRILPNQATQTLFFLCMGLVVILFLDAIFRTVRSYITGWRAAQFEHRASCHALDRLLASEISAFETEKPGTHLYRLAAIGTLRDYYSGQAKLLMVDLPFVSLFLGLIAAFAGWLVLVPVALFTLLGLASWYAGNALQAALRDRATLDDRRTSFVIEALVGVQTIKLLAMEPQMQRRYERLQESSAASSYDVTHVSNIAQGIGWFFSNLTMVFVASFGAGMVINGQLSIGSLAACTLLSGRAVQPVLRAIGLWAQFQNIRIARERVDQIFAYQPESIEATQDVPPLKGRIEIREMKFRYEKQGSFLFDGIDLTVKPGQVVGIRGGTGSGKTTLLMIMMGLIHPTEGRVKFDDCDTRFSDPDALRRQIGFLPQNPVLFQGTILENLTMFDGMVSVEEAITTSESLGLHEKVRVLPNGYETMVGDGAAMQLPIGMSQGIAMTRALAKKPKVILFDEANSGLDSQSDQTLKERLAELKGTATIILVSHRPSLLDLADQIVDLENGKLVTPAKEKSVEKAAQKSDTKPTKNKAGKQTRSKKRASA